MGQTKRSFSPSANTTLLSRTAALVRGETMGPPGLWWSAPVADEREDPLFIGDGHGADVGFPP